MYLLVPFFWRWGRWRHVIFFFESPEVISRALLRAGFCAMWALAGATDGTFSFWQFLILALLVQSVTSYNLQMFRRLSFLSLKLSTSSLLSFKIRLRLIFKLQASLLLGLNINLSSWSPFFNHFRGRISRVYAIRYGHTRHKIHDIRQFKMDMHVVKESVLTTSILTDSKQTHYWGVRDRDTRTRSTRDAI